MKKLKAVALVLALTLVLSACSMVKVDKEMDNAETAVEVNGTVITKGEAMKQLSNYKSNMQYQYAMYQQYFGASITMPTDEEIKADFIDALVWNEVRKQKAAELGLDQLTEDEEAEVATTAQSNHDSYLEQAKTAVTKDGMTDDEIAAAAETYLADNGITMDALIKSTRESFVDNKLTEYTYKDLAVTDDEIAAELTAKSDEQKASYESDPTYIDTQINNSSTVYYYPAGYRYIKNLLVKFKDEDTTALTALQAQLTDVEKQITDYEAAIATPEPTAEPTAEPDQSSAPAPEATSEVTEAPVETEAAEPTAEPTAVPTLDPAVYTQRDDLNTQISVAKLTQIANIRDRVNEVSQKAQSGEDFDTLIADYGEDTGMTAEPAKTYGYILGANTTKYASEFQVAAMALANVGDISEPVETSFGMHILKYSGDVPEGTAELTDSLKQTITDSLMSAKKTAKDTEVKDQWLAAANIKTYPDRLVEYE